MDRRRCCVAHWTETLDTVDDVDKLLEQFGIEQVDKAAGNPLDDDGFDKAVRLWLREFLRTVRTAEATKLKQAIRKLDVDWAKLTARQTEQKISAAAKVAIGISPKIFTEIGKIVERRAAKMVTAAAKATSARYDLGVVPTTNVVDKQVLRHMRTSQTLFVRDEYGRRAEQFSAKARNIVAGGVRDGFDRKQIAELLDTQLTAQGLARSRNYYDTVASIYAARARSYGSLRAFQAAGIVNARWVSVLDEVTTEICRFLDGKIFTVEGSLQKFEEAAAGEPEDVAQVQPFVQQGKDADGNSIMYYKQGEERITVAQIDEPGFGTKDKIGTYSQEMTEAQLEAAGISTPPAHGRCRSVIEPA